MHFSQIYGLTVVSDIAFPELLQVAPVSDPDILIKAGAVPDHALQAPDRDSAVMRARPGELWLSAGQAVRMQVSAGCSITYEAYPGAESDAVRLFLLGSGLGGLLMQRGLLVVHGNVVALPGNGAGAIVCIGDSGAGKSTTAIAMMQRGLSVLADDICAIGAGGHALPGMPRAKIWADTARQLGIDTTPLDRIRAHDAKFNLPLGDRHCSEARPVSAFFALAVGDVETVTLDEVTGPEKFVVLRNNVYRPEYLGPLGIEGDYLHKLARMAADTPVFKVIRPRSGFAIDPLVDAILEAAAAATGSGIPVQPGRARNHGGALMSGTLAPATLLQRSGEVIAADMNGEKVMMRLDEGAYFALTGSGSHIWDALADRVSVAELIDIVREEFETSEVDDLDKMIVEFLTDLVSKRLVLVVD